jgi:phage terminase Nu1 subunit (DNA packaging protein)
MTTQTEIAEHLDLSTRRVRALQDARVFGKDAGLNEARISYIRYLREQAAGRAAKNGLDLTSERARLAKMQADKLEMELSAKRGDLVSVVEAEEAWKVLVGAFRSKLLMFPSRAADVIPGDGAVAERLLKDMIHDALTELSRWEPPA